MQSAIGHLSLALLAFVFLAFYRVESRKLREKQKTVTPHWMPKKPRVTTCGRDNEIPWSNYWKE